MWVDWSWNALSWVKLVNCFDVRSFASQSMTLLSAVKTMAIFDDLTHGFLVVGFGKGFDSEVCLSKIWFIHFYWISMREDMGERANPFDFLGDYFTYCLHSIGSHKVCRIYKLWWILAHGVRCNPIFFSSWFLFKGRCQQI